MSGSPLNHSFAALVEQTGQDIEFEPFTVPAVVAVFQPFSLVQEGKPTAIDPTSETYQRIATPLTEQNNGFQSLLATKDNEVSQLRSFLAERDVQLDELRSRLDVEMAETKKMSVSELAQNIQESIFSMEEHIASDLAHNVSEILAPFVTNQLLQRSLEEFTDTVRKCFAGGDVLKVRIKGPANLLEFLRPVLSDQLVGCEWAEEDSFNVSAELNNKIISTRLDEWSRILVGQ